MPPIMLKETGGSCRPWLPPCACLRVSILQATPPPQNSATPGVSESPKPLMRATQTSNIQNHILLLLFHRSRGVDHNQVGRRVEEYVSPEHPPNGSRCNAKSRRRVACA